MRLFTAIDLPQHILQPLHYWWEGAFTHFKSKEWRPVSPHLWHMTLAFYGDVSGRDVDQLSENLSENAELSPVLQLTTDGIGLFPKAARPSLFWAGVSDQSEQAYLKHLTRCCRRAGHVTVRKRTAKERAFRGHITVARNRILHSSLDLQKLQSERPLPELNWCAETISLYQSVLRPEGPQYHRLETFELKGSCHRTRGKYVR